MQSQIAAKPLVLWRHLASTSTKLSGLGTAMMHFAKLRWSLLIFSCKKSCNRPIVIPPRSKRVVLRGKLYSFEALNYISQGSGATRLRYSGTFRPQ